MVYYCIVMFQGLQVKDSFFHNANSAFRREVWEKYPFDESVTNIEDRVWGEHLISKGYNIIYEPESSVYHWHGINQDLNPDRAKNIVKILEGLDTINANSNHQKPKDLKTLAIIPVRGQSCEINNSSLLERTIKSAKSSKFVSDVVVATDNLNTISLAKSLGADAPFIRPDRLSEEYVDIFDIVEFTLDWFEKKQKNYDVVVLLEEIYPFRPVGMIDNMIEKLVCEGHDTVVAGMPELRGIWTERLNNIELLQAEEKLTMPSALKESENIIGLIGLCCVTFVASLRNDLVFSGKVGVIKINDPLSVISVKNDQEKKIACILDKNL